MTFRLRLLLGFLAVAAVPLAVLGLGVRREVTARLTEQYERRGAALAAAAGADLARTSDGVAARLATLRAALAQDTRFRLAVVQRSPAERTYLLDLAGEVMRLAGLAYLQIQDADGRVLSSGHFRQDFDRLDPAVPAGLARLGATGAVVRARAPDGPFHVLARLDSLRLGDARLTLAGGVPVDELVRRLAADPDVAVALALPDTTLGAPGESAAALTLAAADVATVDPETGAIGQGRLVLAFPLTPLEALRRGVDRWFLTTGAATTAAALLLALWLSGVISRPVRALAEAAGAIDLERADVGFASDRRDEVGVLARLLEAMVGRLRGQAGRLREAERRAAMGDLARQVNHDVKNGLTPIRNVFRHLDEVARHAPAGLAAVFGERRGTIESGIAYLERLAGHYARLAPTVGWQECDVNALVGEVAAGAAGPATVRFEAAHDLPRLRTDPLALRRVVENLVRNGVDSLADARGEVRLVTEPTPGGVRIRIADTGRGMTGEEIDRAVEPFYTTKPSGSGLGLPIVRRLVADLGGSFRVTSEPGRGTEVVVELPSGRRDEE